MKVTDSHADKKPPFTSLHCGTGPWVSANVCQVMCGKCRVCLQSSLLIVLSAVPPPSPEIDIHVGGGRYVSSPSIYPVKAEMGYFSLVVRKATAERGKTQLLWGDLSWGQIAFKIVPFRNIKNNVNTLNACTDYGALANGHNWNV